MSLCPSVCLSVRPAQTCLKVSILILEQSRSVYGQSKVSLKSVTGQLQVSCRSVSVLSVPTSSDRRSLKYFVLFVHDSHLAKKTNHFLCSKSCFNQFIRYPRKKNKNNHNNCSSFYIQNGSLLHLADFLLSVEAILGYAQEISVESQLLLSSDIVKMRISSPQPSKPVT